MVKLPPTPRDSGRSASQCHGSAPTHDPATPLSNALSLGSSSRRARFDADGQSRIGHNAGWSHCAFEAKLRSGSTRRRRTAVGRAAMPDEFGVGFQGRDPPESSSAGGQSPCPRVGPALLDRMTKPSGT